MNLDEILFQLNDLAKRIPFSNYEVGERQKYSKALTEAIVILRHIKMCVDMAEDSIKQPIDFEFYEKPTNYNEMQYFNQPESNIIATVNNPDWKDKMLKNFMGRVE